MNSKVTESRNIKTEDIHLRSTKEIIEIINSEDATVAFSVKKQLDNIKVVISLFTKPSDVNKLFI